VVADQPMPCRLRPELDVDEKRRKEQAQPYSSRFHDDSFRPAFLQIGMKLEQLKRENAEQEWLCESARAQKDHNVRRGMCRKQAHRQTLERACLAWAQCLRAARSRTGGR
jgi:hypothetical protein